MNSIRQSPSKSNFNRSSESSISSSAPEISLSKSLGIEVPSIKRAFEDDTKIRQFLNQLAPQQMLDKTEIQTLSLVRLWMDTLLFYTVLGVIFTLLAPKED